MKSIFLLSVLLSVVFSQNVIPPSNSYIQYSGRITSNYSFEWPGIEIRAGFTGTSLAIILDDSNSANMFNIFIDDTYFVLNGTNSQKPITLASGLADGNHNFMLTKRTESFYGTVTFGGLVLDANANLLPPPPALTRKIEFIGDSITCGFGVIGTAPCNYSAPTEDNYMAYGRLIATAVQADLHVESWSGIGMVRNARSPNITSAKPLPVLFPYILATGDTTPWDFSSWVPDAVVINLGTNDYGSTPYPPPDVYEAGYLKFVSYLQSVYNPVPKFFFVCGPQQNTVSCPYVQSVAQQAGATYINIEGILLPTDIGCDGHPGVTGHQKMANHTLPAIQSVMGW